MRTLMLLDIQPGLGSKETLAIGCVEALVLIRRVALNLLYIVKVPTFRIRRPVEVPRSRMSLRWI